MLVIDSVKSVVLWLIGLLHREAKLVATTGRVVPVNGGTEAMPACLLQTLIIGSHGEIKAIFFLNFGRLWVQALFSNCRVPVKDFVGGDDNFTSVSYMAIPEAPMQTIATLIFDGVLERFPGLKVGMIELGAVWVPGFMRQLDAAFAAFERHEERLQKLSLTPSDYVRRQVRVTPYPTEPTGWIIEQSGPEICMFSSDYPHVEGGRNPLRRFDAEVAGLDVETQDRFYRANFEDLWR